MKKKNLLTINQLMLPPTLLAVCSVFPIDAKELSSNDVNSNSNKSKIAEKAAPRKIGSEKNYTAEGDNAVDPGLSQIIQDQLGVDASQVTPDANITNNLGADSIDRVELILGVEDKYGIKVPDQDAEKIETVGDMNQYINQNQNSN